MIEAAEHPNQVLVVLDARGMKGKAEYHRTCAEAFSFPDYYGKNGDARIDCMTCLDDEVISLAFGV